ncbi:MAG: helix-turn-helix transcriptional regulator [Lutisporaceae bacterium]
MFSGEKLKQLRTEKSLTQIELAKLFNTSHATINRYEKGVNEPDSKTITKFADFFNISTDYILDRTNIRNGAMQSKYDLDPNNIEYKSYKEIIDKFKSLLEQEGIITENDPIPQEAFEQILKYGVSAAIEILKLKLKK